MLAAAIASGAVVEHTGFSTQKTSKRTPSSLFRFKPIQVFSLCADMYDDQRCSSASFCLAHATQVLRLLQLEALEFHVFGQLAGAHLSPPATPSRQKTLLYLGPYTM